MYLYNSIFTRLHKLLFYSMTIYINKYYYFRAHRIIEWLFVSLFLNGHEKWKRQLFFRLFQHPLLITFFMRKNEHKLRMEQMNEKLLFAVWLKWFGEVRKVNWHICSWLTVKLRHVFCEENLKKSIKTTVKYLRKF